MHHIIAPIDSNADRAAPWSCDIDCQKVCVELDVKDPSGRLYTITIEVQENKLVLQCFDPVHDLPMRVRLSADGTIETDDERFGEQIIHHDRFQNLAPDAGRGD
ncbi:hypothetical protein [Mesorhizobium comanense]|uniref:hypothetical protein n=1 Tax=Mesorhizobium comanense TaxID=2502215 RepID=UPI0010FA4C55|nr:hypothetical protein [Mesorhizobium comanense]